LLDSTSIGFHQAQGHHGKGQRSGINNVQQGISWQLAALYQLVYQQRK
jgi:hypothetical protein